MSFCIVVLLVIMCVCHLYNKLTYLLTYLVFWLHVNIRRLYLIAKHFQPVALVAHFASEQVQFGGDFVLVAGLDELHFSTAPEQEPRHLGNSCTCTCSRLLIGWASHRALTSFGWCSLRLLTERWPGWVDLGGWLHTKIDFPHPDVEPPKRSPIPILTGPSVE